MRTIQIVEDDKALSDGIVMNKMQYKCDSQASIQPANKNVK